MTRKRILSAAVMLGLFLASLQFERLWWLLPALIIAFGVLCLSEMALLIEAKNLRFPFPLCLIGVLVLGWDGYVAGLRHGAAIVAGSMILLLFYRVWLSDYGNVAAEVGSALLAIAYIGLPMGMAAALSQMTDASGAVIGKCLLAYQAAVVFGGDSAAYFVGRHFGRTPFFTRISPKKTVEGAVACVVGSIVIAAIVILLAPSLKQFLGVRHGLLLGAILGVMSPFGDLAESVFKRDAGRKDSGFDFTGHGGFLDIFDALLFGLPIQFCYIQLVLANP